MRLRALSLLASDTYHEDAISAAIGASIPRASEYQNAREALGNVPDLEPCYACASHRTPIILTRISRDLPMSLGPKLQGHFRDSSTACSPIKELYGTADVWNNMRKDARRI
ncbi:hypothetical protein B0H19DRAFT_1081625 [Mycena capillaripes]|nr:hypothetical protein B0H19DRAFT_1081625 [Mycena capillaripes]